MLALEHILLTEGETGDAASLRWIHNAPQGGTALDTLPVRLVVVFDALVDNPLTGSFIPSLGC